MRAQTDCHCAQTHRRTMKVRPWCVEAHYLWKCDIVCLFIFPLFIFPLLMWIFYFWYIETDNNKHQFSNTNHYYKSNKIYCILLRNIKINIFNKTHNIYHFNNSIYYDKSNKINFHEEILKFYNNIPSNFLPSNFLWVQFSEFKMCRLFPLKNKIKYPQHLDLTRYATMSKL